MKIFFLFFFCVIISCTEILPDYDTEILCADNSRFLIYNTDYRDVILGLKNHIKQRYETHTDENYTVIKLPDGRNTHIRNITPEQMIKCKIYNVTPKRIKTYLM